MKQIRKFRNCPFSDDELMKDYPNDSIVFDFDKDETLRDKEFLQQVFCPDPVTGWPCSSLSLLINDKTPPEIKEYLKNSLRISTPQYDSEDDETLMAVTENAPRRFQYGLEREKSLTGLRELISKYDNIELDG